MLHPLGNPMLTGLLCDLALFQAYPFSARGGEKDGGFLCSCGSLLSLLGLCRQRNHAEARRQICQHLDDNALRLYAPSTTAPSPRMYSRFPLSGRFTGAAPVRCTAWFTN